MTNWQEA